MKELEKHPPLLGEMTQFADKYPDRPALYCLDAAGALCQVTYAQVLARVSACCQRFAALPESRIGILGANSIELACNVWGVIAAGKSAVLLDPTLTSQELTDAMAKADVSYLIRDEDFWDLDANLRQLFPALHVTSPVSEREAPCFCPREEGNVVFFTSGTSKSSKVVETPAWAFCGDVSAQAHLIRHEPGDLVLLPLPLHHSFGFAALNIFYKLGCPVFIGSMRSLMADVRQVPCQIMALVPKSIETLLKHKAFPPTLKSILVSGGYCPVELAQAVRQQGILVQNRYGSSEISCGVGENLPEDEVDTLTLHAGTRVEIAEDQEVIVTTPYTMSGYYKNPEETAEVLRGGKVYTGDAGELDAQGRLRLFGRKKDMILMANGEKLHCGDVDAALSALEGVQEGAAIYVNQELIAVLRPRPEASEAQVREAAARYNAGLPYQRRMKRVWVHPDPFPYTSSGKLQRRKLEEAYLAQSK